MTVCACAATAAAAAAVAWAVADALLGANWQNTTADLDPHSKKGPVVCVWPHILILDPASAPRPLIDLPPYVVEPPRICVAVCL
jgi:hypothetical protein